MPSNDRPLVLLTNDDGYDADGLVALRTVLARKARVVVIAPLIEQSACSHALTLHRALRLRLIRKDWYALDGTPADCVYVGLFAGDRLLPRRPDVVVSGINRGLNLGFDIYYSGTVAAAREAAIRGVPAVAVSADVRSEPKAAAGVGAQVAWAAMKLGEGLSVPLLLNVNIPPGRHWTLRATRPGRRTYGEGVDFRVDPRGREYLWIGAPGVHHGSDPGTDTDAFDRGEVGVSSLEWMPRIDSADDLAAQVVRFLGRQRSTRKNTR